MLSEKVKAGSEDFQVAEGSGICNALFMIERSDTGRQYAHFWNINPEQVVAQTTSGVGSSPIRKLTPTGRRGEEAFSEMPGGRALSFHGLSVGETPGPGRSRGEQREGAKLPHIEKA